MKSLLYKNRSGFSVVEVIVAAVIFGIAAAGIFATISALREPAEQSDDRVAAAYAGKEILEELRGQIDASTWNTGNISLGTHTGSKTLNVTYNYTYTVSEVDPGNPLSPRKVNLDINY